MSRNGIYMIERRKMDGMGRVDDMDVFCIEKGKPLELSIDEFEKQTCLISLEIVVGSF